MSDTVRIRSRIAWVVMGDLVAAGVVTRALANHGFVVRLTHKKEDVDRDFRSALRVDLLVLDTNDKRRLAESITTKTRRRLPSLPVLYISGKKEDKWARALETEEARFITVPKPLDEHRIKKTISLVAERTEIQAAPEPAITRFS